ncbi:hypothetical protein ACQCVK_13575 [Rossellomorea vietnamensis]|uniref:hypothetical protein n=1 Tax=Rossellomorea vietnamensis TaxID=218284 RepID=UPI003CF6F8B6
MGLTLTLLGILSSAAVLDKVLFFTNLFLHLNTNYFKIWSITQENETKKKLILIPDELPFVEQDDIINWSSVIASLLLIILIYLF